MTRMSLVLLFALIGLCFAQNSIYVEGYYRSDGTYVAPHYRSSPDGNFYNNWSTKGNYNPYTGKAGTKTMPSPSTAKDNSAFFGPFEDAISRISEERARARIVEAEHQHELSIQEQRQKLQKREMQLEFLESITTNKVYGLQTRISAKKKLLEILGLSNPAFEYDEAVYTAGIPQEFMAFIDEFPDSVHAKVALYAQKAHPSNIISQSKFISLQKQGYRKLRVLYLGYYADGMPEDVLVVSEYYSKNAAPEDYVQQAELFNSSIESFFIIDNITLCGDWTAMPEKISDAIINNATTKWQYNYPMIAYTLQNQINGYYVVKELLQQLNQLPQDKKRAILDKAKKEWPGDLSAQAYLIESELSKTGN